MIRESISLKMRGGPDGLRTLSNTVKIKVTGRADLEQLAKTFDREAAALRKAGNHARAAVIEASARRCRTSKNFQMSMPADKWAKLKGGK